MFICICLCMHLNFSDKQETNNHGYLLENGNWWMGEEVMGMTSLYILLYLFTFAHLGLLLFVVLIT